MSFTIEEKDRFFEELLKENEEEKKRRSYPRLIIDQFAFKYQGIF